MTHIHTRLNDQFQFISCGLALVSTLFLIHINNLLFATNNPSLSFNKLIALTELNFHKRHHTLHDQSWAYI